jgi:hypothetical protein
LAFALLVPVLPCVPDDVAAADEPRSTAAAVPKAEFERLLGDLNAASRRVRAEAERALLALGPAILPELPPPELLPNASVREAVRRIRVALERTKARESVAASRVTLKTTASLETILKAVESQTGNGIDAERLPAALRQQQLDIDSSRQPFWPVIDDLAARAKFRCDFSAGKNRLVLLPLDDRAQPAAPPVELAVSSSGPFRIAVVSAALRPLFGDEAHDLLRVRLAITAEPRLRPLFLKYTGRDLTAARSPNAALAPLNPDASYELPLGEAGRHLEFAADFQVPSDAHGSFDLKGRLTMHTAAGTENISFSDLARAAGVARRRGGVTVTLLDAAFRETEAAGRDLAVRVGVGYDSGGPAFESHRTWIFHNDVFLETKDGRRLELNGGFETTLQADGGVAVTYRFRGLKDRPADYRFIYVAPTLLINVPIEFEFSKIPVAPRGGS